MQVRFEKIVEEDADDACGDAGDDDLAPEPQNALLHDGLRLVLPLEGEKPFPEHDDDGEDGAQLNDDVEHLFEGVARVEGQKLVEEDEVSRAGNGQPFGDALHDAEEDDFENLYEGIHGSLPKKSFFRDRNGSGLFKIC